VFRVLTLVTGLSALAVSGCASIPLAGPTRFYVSYSGESSETQPLFDLVDARMRLEPGFSRDFTEPLNLHIEDGQPLGGGRYRYEVQFSVPSRLQGRRLDETRRELALFSVTCALEHPEPCADTIVARARQQPARIRRLLARSPSA
jgi:hypothetical protein